MEEIWLWGSLIFFFSASWEGNVNKIYVFNSLFINLESEMLMFLNEHDISAL